MPSQDKYFAALKISVSFLIQKLTLFNTILHLTSLEYPVGVCILNKIKNIRISEHAFLLEWYGLYVSENNSRSRRPDLFSTPHSRTTCSGSA